MKLLILLMNVHNDLIPIQSKVVQLQRLMVNNDYQLLNHVTHRVTHSHQWLHPPWPLLADSHSEICGYPVHCIDSMTWSLLDPCMNSIRISIAVVYYSYSLSIPGHWKRQWWSEHKDHWWIDHRILWELKLKWYRFYCKWIHMHACIIVIILYCILMDIATEWWPNAR